MARKLGQILGVIAAGLVLVYGLFILVCQGVGC